MVPRGSPFHPDLFAKVSLNVLYPEPPNQNDGHRIKGGILKKRKCFIKMYLTASDRAKIVQAAKDCGMSLSMYIRTFALGNVPVSNMDLDEMSKVMKVHADIGRLGGLLKMFLTNDERLNDMGREMGVATIDGTLVDIRATQAKLLELVDVVLKKAKG